MGDRRAQLENWLGQLYHIDIDPKATEEGRQTARRLAKEAVAADQELAKEVDEYIKEIEPVVRYRKDRAHVEMKTLEYLNAVKAEPKNG